MPMVIYITISVLTKVVKLVFDTKTNLLSFEDSKLWPFKSWRYPKNANFRIPIKRPLGDLELSERPRVAHRQTAQRGDGEFCAALSTFSLLGLRIYVQFIELACSPAPTRVQVLALLTRHS